MKKQQIQKPALLRAQVYDLIMSYIGNGFYKPGDHLTEERVARDLGVSRTPVREALSQLDVNRLLVSRKNGGYLVRSLSVEEMAHIFEVRTLIEPHAVSCIAAGHSDEQQQALERALQKEVQFVDDRDADAFARANEEFRNALFDALANTELKRCITQFDDYMQLLRLVTLSDFATRRIVIAGHREILAAIAAGDKKRARQAMLQHIENARVCVIGAMEKDQHRETAVLQGKRTRSGNAEMKAV